MYKIIGADGKEYGPVGADQIRQWIAEGRANAQTKIQAEGSTEWRLLSEFPEFADALNAAVPPKYMPPTTAPVKTSRAAIASLVLGILSFVSCGLTALITSPLGLILGLVAINKIKKSDGRLGGQGYALAGAIVSGITLLLIPFFAGLLLPALSAAKQKAQTIACVNNVKQLALAIHMYASDNHGRFPTATNWCDAIFDHAGTDKVFQCPAADSKKRCHYAFNAKLSGIEAERADPDTVIIFESDAGWNASGGPELAPPKARHRQRFVVAFADGSVRQVSETELKQLHWEPEDEPQ